MLSFEDFMQKEVTGQKFICHCYNEIEKTDFFSNINNSGLFEDITVLIGPEGDFSINEVHQALQQQYKSTTLGNSRFANRNSRISSCINGKFGKSNLTFLLRTKFLTALLTEFWQILIIFAP